MPNKTEAKRSAPKASASKKASKSRAKAQVVQAEVKSAGPRVSGWDRAAAMLLRSENGLTPTQIQKKTGLSRKFSRWDMNNISKWYRLRLITGANRAGQTVYRLAERTPRKAAAKTADAAN